MANIQYNPAEFKTDELDPSQGAVLGRESAIRLISEVVVAPNYLSTEDKETKKPILFRSLNMSGAGKTFFGRRLAELLAARRASQTEEPGTIPARNDSS